ncbi:MAG: EAL domain-containing protein [Betaproteobacteria bacterium]|nr:EAL domain-containing protein [Betaproteobacteria bacterium]
MNELTAGSAPRDPLLGWAGLDASGRIVSLGGRLAGLRIGTRLAEALDEPGVVERFLREAVAADAVDADVDADLDRQAGTLTVRCRVAGTAPGTVVTLRLRRERPTAGAPRFAAEFHDEAPGGETAAPSLAALPPLLLAPSPLLPSNPAAADAWRLGSALYPATVAPAPNRPIGLIRFALHPVALPRLAAVDDLDPWIAASLARLASSAALLGIEAVAARTGTRELTAWVRDGTGCAKLCEHWLSAMAASPLVGSRCRLVVGPSAAWCVMPADGQVLGYLLDALDAVYAPAGPGPSRPAMPVSSVARERDVAERREPLTGTLVELVSSGRARLAGEPVIDAPTGLPSGMHLRAEFRSLFAMADLIDYLPDIVEDDRAADALNGWLAVAVRAATAGRRRGRRGLLQVRIAPAQLRRLDSLVPVIAAMTEAGDGEPPCLMLPEAAVHRDAYLVIDAAAEVAALGAAIGIDDYRGLLPPAQLAQAGIGALRLHRSLVRELGERSFAGARLGDLLARARGAGMQVLVAGLSDRMAVAAAGAAGALHLSGPVFGRPQRFVAAAASAPASDTASPAPG